MEFEFLKNFASRMKRVGAYALIYKNSLQKTTWKNFYFIDVGEQTNIIFAVLLFIMEQSLKDETCTMDDIGNFIDNINMNYFKKPLSYDDCKELANFIINTILCDGGNAMYFNAYDFEKRDYTGVNINFLANEIVYIDNSVRRTNYSLSDDGYALLLSTLEMEANMRLSIHEFIFKLHLEKQNYDKAVDEVKNIFAELRRQMQKMHDAVLRIRQNALSFSVHEYKELMMENLNTLDSSKNKFDNYRNYVKDRIVEFEEKDINIKKLDEVERNNLNYLKVIEKYLSRAIDEQQKILIAHFDLKDIYTKELEDLSQMSLIKRFNIKSDLYEKVINDITKLEDMHYLFKPLYKKGLKKTYNINKCLQYQKPIKKKAVEEDEEILSFDEKEWALEQARLKREMFEKYQNSLKVIIKLAYKNGSISLSKIKEEVDDNENLLNNLIPSVEIFREIIIEMLKNKSINIDELKEERDKFTADGAPEFQLNESILSIIEEDEIFSDIKVITTSKLFNEKKVKFKDLKSAEGIVKVVTCSDVEFRVEE